MSGQPKLIPEPSKRHNVVISDKDWNILISLGEGKACLGLQKIVAEYRKTK